MLYDILSPLAFFVALGGITLIVARVVIRIRRQQLQAGMKNSAMTATAPAAPLWQPEAREVSQLLRPTQKSVHALRSRFSLLAQSFTQTKTGLQSWRARRQEKRGQEQQKAEVPEKPTLTAPPAEAPTSIMMPRRRLRLPRPTFWKRSAIESTEVNPAAPEPTPKKIASVSSPTSTPAPPPQSPPAATVPTATPVSTPVPAKPVAPLTPTVDRNFASALLRRVQYKQSPAPTALQAAAAEVVNQHYQAAEDLLVPYIVKHPKDTTAYLLLGRAALGREAWEEAIEIFEQVIKWNRKEPGAYAGLGEAAYKAGHFTRALQALQRAQDADPDNRILLEMLLSIAQKMDNPALQHSILAKLDTLDVRVPSA